MSIIAQGKIVEFVLLVITMTLTYFYLYKAVIGKLKDPIRMLSQFLAISDGVDKAVEEGKYIYVTAGIYAYLSGMYAAMTINGMNVMRYLARLAVRRGAKIRFIAAAQPETIALIDGIWREVCVTEGRPEVYDPDAIRFYGATEAGYSTGSGADVLATGASLLVAIGAPTSAERFMLGAARQNGALIVGGTPRYFHQSTYALMADYPLYCDDIYAAGALASGDEEVAASIVGGDVVKLMIIIGIILFTLLGIAGIPTWQKGTGWLYQ